jgi:hypothetical protein
MEYLSKLAVCYESMDHGPNLKEISGESSVSLRKALKVSLV